MAENEWHNNYCFYYHPSTESIHTYSATAVIHLNPPLVYMLTVVKLILIFHNCDTQLLWANSSSILKYWQPTIKYIGLSFDAMVELRLKIMQMGCPALEAHPRVICGLPHGKFAHACTNTFHVGYYHKMAI